MKCRICQHDKTPDCFGNNKNKPSGKNSFCKDCKKDIDKVSYKKRKISILNQKRDKRKEFQEQYNDFKSSLGCAKCGEDKHYMLDFHHTDRADKGYNIGLRAWGVLSMELLKQEIEKCVVLCSNDHREFHYLQKNNGISIREYLK